MNKLSIAKRAKVVRLLVEGSSLRTISRAEDLSINTVTSILVQVGKACLQFHNDTVVNIPAKRVQADEIWSFVYCKDKNVDFCPIQKQEEQIGDAWTWVGMDADTKLVIGWLVGDRDAATANDFMRDIASRLKHRVQLTTDGHKPYLKAVENAFDDEIDFAQLIKIYGAAEGTGNDKKYSPPACIGIEKKWVSGDPDPKHISTSYVERQNLTMRMSMRRFTRLTNAFSKKLENHICAIAIHYAYYNFCRIHKTLRVTPAMEAKIATRPMTIEDLVRIGYADEIAKEEKIMARRMRYSVTH